jgi:hypothetical protein
MKLSASLRPSAVHASFGLVAFWLPATSEQKDVMWRSPVNHSIFPSLAFGSVERSRTGGNMA